MKKSFAALCVAILSFATLQNSFAQCDPLIPAPVGAHCDDQRAEFKLDDSNPKNEYEWFRDAAGTLTDGTLGSADGKTHVSQGDIPANTPSADFYYRRKTPRAIGPTNIATTGATSAGINVESYEMEFTSALDFTLNSVNVFAKGYVPNINNYGLQVRLVPKADVATATAGQFSNWTKFAGSNTLELRTIAAKLEVKANIPYVIQIRSVTDATAGVTKVDEIYWYPTSAYTATTYLTTPTTVAVTPVSKNVNGSPRYPLISDWDITVKCPLVKVSSIRRTTGCCTSVGNNFTVTSPYKVAEPGNFPMTITASGTDAKDGFYYEWYDSKGNLVPGSGGTGNKTLIIQEPGTYKVRMVESAVFASSYSCYKEQGVQVQNRVLTALASITNVCIGEKVTLTARGATEGITWTPAKDLSSTTAKVVTATPSTAGKVTYTVKATVPVGNIVIDGDFMESTTNNRKFESKYNFDAVRGVKDNNQALIGTRAAATWDITNRFCDDAAGFYDQGRGAFLFADAQSQAMGQAVPANWGQNNFIWQQSNLPVIANQLYTFRILATDWGVEDLTNANNTADVMMYVNGQPILAQAVELKTRCKWTEIIGTWNSGAATSATLTISDVNAKSTGGEFAIDDISFGAPGIQEDTVTLNVSNCGFLNARNDTTLCLAAPVRLTATTNGIITKWTPATGLDDPNSVSPLATPTATTTYTVEAKFPLVNHFDASTFPATSALPDFKLNYKYNNGIGAGEYGIAKGADTWLYDPIYTGNTDHTPGGGTNYLIARTTTGQDNTIYSKAVTVAAGETIGVTFFATNLHVRMEQNPDLRLTINIGGATKTVTFPKDRNWRAANFSWTAAAAGTVTVQLISPKEATSGERVFGLDDFVVASLGNTTTDKVTVTLKDCFYLDTLPTGTCQGDSLKIGVKTNGLFTGWTLKSGTGTIRDPKSPITWVKPTSIDTLVATAKLQVGNLVQNGDFEAGDGVNFSSDYTCCLTYGGGHYSIAKNPDASAGWAVTAKKDHTSGSGLMYLSDGGSDPTKAVYKTTVTVETGKQYAFSAWLANIHTTFAAPSPDTTGGGSKTTYLAFFINGKLQNGIKLPLDTAWHQYYSLWTADVNGPIQIEIRDRETSQNGNDFALDDIVFGPLAPQTKTVKIAVPPCIICNKPTAVKITNAKPIAQCEGSSLAIAGTFTNGGKAISSPAPNNHMYYSWYKKGVAPVYTVLPDPTGTTVTAIPVNKQFASLVAKTDSGTYVLRVQDGNNPGSTCFMEDSVKVKVIAIPAKPKAIDTSFCQKIPNASFDLKPAAGDSLVWYDATGTTILTTSLNPINTSVATPDNAPITYQVAQWSLKALGQCKGPLQVVKANIIALPIASAGKDTSICGNTFQLNGTLPANWSGKWTASTPGISFNPATATNPVTVADNLPSGTSGTPVKIPFIWTLSKAACPSVSDTIVVTRSGDLTDPKPTADDTTICIGGSVKLNGSNVSAANLETSSWSVNATAGVTLNASPNVAAASASFTKSGSYIFTYTIDNPTCNPSAKTIKVIVMDSARAEILTPLNVKSEETGNVTYRDTFVATSLQSQVGYKGFWGLSAIGTLDTSGTTATLSGLQFDQTTTLSWNVQDIYKACPAAKAALIIIRKDFTTANVEEDKKICILPASNLSLKGISKPQPGLEYLTWSVKSGNAVITIPNPADSSVAAFDPQGGPGTYVFYYSITNRLLKKTTRDSVTVRVDAVTLVPNPYLTFTGTNAPFDNVATPYLVCSNQVALQGVQSTQSALTKTWWQKESGTVNPITDSSATSTITGLAGKAYLTLHYQNGVCPAEVKNFYIEKVGDITAAELSISGGVYNGHTLTFTKKADTLCLGGTYTLNALKLPVTGVETGTWRVVQGTSVSLNSPLNGDEQSLLINETGSTEISWKIENSALASCAPNELVVKLTVNKAPDITSVTGPASLCEESSGDYTVAFTSTLPAKINWIDTTNSTAVSQVTIEREQLVATYAFRSLALTGTTDNAFVKTSVANACGISYKDLPVTLNLKPRTFDAVTDTVEGPKAFCESSTGVRWRLLQPQTQATNYQWEWDGQVQTSETDTSVIIVPSQWAGKSTAKVKVTLVNACGVATAATARDSINVQIIPAVDFKISLTSLTSQGNSNKFCVPTEGGTFTADVVSPSLYNVSPQFQFEVDRDTVQPFGATSTYTASQGTLGDSSVITVRAKADPAACLKTYDDKAVLVMEGFERPAAVIYPDKLRICEQGQGDVTLTVKRTTTKLGSFNDNGQIFWIKDTDTVSTNQFILRLNKPEQSGEYKVLVNASVCTSSTSDTSSVVKIYEMPEAHFDAADPFIIYYQEGQVVRMPAVLTKPVTDTLIYIRYSPEKWLLNPDSLNTKIVTTREEGLFTYTLTLMTGDTDQSSPARCVNTFDIRVLNTIDLKIPNAFSPNDDNLNDVWVIEGLAKYPNTRVKIFNRWGSSMYVDSDGYKVAWDGKHNGIPLAAGTYYFVLELKGSPDNTDRNIASHLTIIR